MVIQNESYPESAAQRNAWILQRRPARVPVFPSQPHHYVMEKERARDGSVIDSATVFLTNRECPWKCLMCDLWKHTLPDSVPPGAIPKQVDVALDNLGLKPGSDEPFPRPAQLKLYNSGSFFDPGAIPVVDYPDIAGRCQGFERVIVECHPSLVTTKILAFRDLLQDLSPPVRLEVALGLETSHPEVLKKLNKGMDLALFEKAARFLEEHHIDLRVFVLVKPPFMNNVEALRWSLHSVNFAADCRATVVSLIPTRVGNGALETLQAQGQFSPPELALFERAVDDAMALNRCRVFADLWDLGIFSQCEQCLEARQERLQTMNLEQQILPRITCSACQCGFPQ